MTLQRLHIDGYLQFSDRTLDFGPGVNVVHGPNEAGKSTLLRFVRYVLFGPPHYKSNRGRPLAGGRYGGTLWFGPQGLAVERFSKELRLLGNGVPRPESALNDILGGFDEAAFEAVFACDLNGLMQMGALDDESLRRRLFATTVVGFGADIDEVEKRWDERRRKLNKRSSNGIIYRLEQDLKDAREQLDQARSEALTLPDRFTELHALDAELKRLRDDARTSSRARDHLQHVVDCRGRLARREQLLAWLDEHDEPSQPAAVWTHRLASLKEAGRVMELAEGEASAQRTRWNGLVEQRDAIELDAALLAAGPRVRSVIEAHTTLPSLDDLKRREREADRNAKRQLEKVGLDGLDGVDLRTQTVHEITSIAERVPPSADLDAPRRGVEQTVEALREAELALADCPEPGAVFELQHRVDGIFQADARAREAAAEADELEEKQQRLSEERERLDAEWPRLPGLDAKSLGGLVRRVDAWRDDLRERQIARKTVAEQVESVRRELQRLSEPVPVREVPVSLVQWAERRREMNSIAARIDERSAHAGQLRQQLERQLDSVPVLGGLADLRSCQRVSWTELGLLTKSLLEAAADVEGGVVPDEVPGDRAELVEAQHVGLALHARRDSGQRWRFATRTVLVLLALLVGGALVGWLLGQVSALLVVAVFAGLLFLAALVAEVVLGFSVARASRELAALDAEDRDTWLGELQHRIARIELQEGSLLSRGASEARRDARERSREQLARVVADVELLSGVEWVDLAELAQRAPACMEGLQKLDRLQAEIESLKQTQDGWAAEGARCAKVIESDVPGNWSEAYALAEQVLQAAEMARQDKAREEQRKKTVREKTAELQEREQLLRELAKSTAQDERIREEMLAAGADGVTERRWNDWVQAGLRASAIGQQLGEIESRLEILRDRLLRDQAVVDEALARANIDDLEALGPAVDLAVKRQKALEAAQQTVDEAGKALENRRRELARAEAANRARAEAMEALQRALEQSGWPEERPDRVAALAERLRAARDAERARVDLVEEERQCAGEWEDWVAALRALCEDLGRPVPERVSARRELGALQDAFDAATKAATRRSALAEHADAAEREHAEAVERRERAKASLAKARESAGVESEEEAIRRLEAAQAWEEKRDALEETEGLLRAKLGDVDLSSIQHGDEVELRERLEQCEAGLAELESRIAERTEARGVRADELEALQRSADVVEAAERVGAIEAELRQARLELAEIELASQWLKDEYDRFVRENQPAVLKRASELLEGASGGTMVAVIQEGDQLYVQGPDGKPREPGQLSRGTREMLFLVIRLALALEHAERTRVPILLDDVMVNQDPERAEQIARVVRLVGKQHQVIFMTCRPELRDLIRDTDSTARVIELERFAGLGAPVGTTRVASAGIGEPGTADLTDEVDAALNLSVDDVVDRVAKYLASSPGWHKRRDIIRGARISDSDWTRFLSTGPEAARIEHNGRTKRGSAYRAARVGDGEEVLVVEPRVGASGSEGSAAG